MKYTATVISLVGATFLGALATAVPAQAKPCCYNNGDYFESSPSTCRNYGGRVVQQEYCVGGYYDGRGYYDDRGYGYDRDDTYFSIQLGNIVFGYSDGYYDRSRRWHRWRSDRERNWYRQHRRASYYHMPRDRDRDRGRRDWRDGRRDHWRD